MKWTTFPAFPKKVSAMDYADSSYALIRKHIYHFHLIHQFVAG